MPTKNDAPQNTPNTTQKSNFINIKYLSLFIGIILLAIISFFAYQATFLFQNKIHPKVVVGNIAVGNLSKEEAVKKIQTDFEQNKDLVQATAVYKDKKWLIKQTDIGLSIDPQKLSEEAYKIGRYDDKCLTFQNLFFLAWGNTVIPLNPNYNKEILHKFLDNVAKLLDADPKNATLKLTDKKEVELVPEIVGIKVDIDKTLIEFNDKINNTLIFSFDIVVEESPPKVTTTDLNGIDTLLASYTTYFNSYDYNRTKNIIIASDKITNIIIHPNEVFSFNQTVGLRLPQFGYLPAPAYINGKLEMDWGGGVCQVSTTLYNTVLLSGLKIVERSNHFRPVSYVPLGQDATVADHYLDLKFSNSFDNNIYLTSEVSGGQITINIFGKKVSNNPEYYISHAIERYLGNQTIIKEDPTLSEGKEVVEEEGHGGLVVSSYRTKKENGVIVSTEHLYTDVFPAFNKIIKKGTQKDPLAITDESPKDTKSQKDNKKDKKDKKQTEQKEPED